MDMKSLYLLVPLAPLAGAVVRLLTRCTDFSCLRLLPEHEARVATGGTSA